MTQLSSQTRRRLALIVIAMFAMAVGTAFSIVWMKQQMYRTARSSGDLENEYAETIRRLTNLDERIATMHQPIVLQGRIAGTLRPSIENQIVWVRENQRASGRIYAVAEPYEASMDLAFIDLRRSNP